MKLSMTLRKTTVSLSTRYTAITFQQALGFVKDLVGDSGYNATAKDLFNLVSSGRGDKLYEKLVFEIKGESPISHFAIQKLGNVYTLLMCKENGGELFSTKATKLINLIENYNPSVEYVQQETIRAKHLHQILDAIKKAKTSRGKHATVSQVLNFLQPNLKLGVGRYVCHTPLHQVTFNAFLGNIICEVTDINDFKTTVLKAVDLELTLA